MFHEYYVIPLSWKNLLRKMMLQDCEIRVPGLGEKKAVGSLMSRKNKLRITGILLSLLLGKLFACALILSFVITSTFLCRNLDNVLVLLVPYV